MIRSLMMISIHLLDSSQSHPLQIWEFSAPDSISLGRGSDNGVHISHPYVSRAHATIMRSEEGEDVREITESPYFNQLQEKLKQLRKNDTT